jgi:mRNA interferase MazF
VKRGDIWTAAAGGGYVGKPRPVVIIQADLFDATASVTVCAFTTDPTDAPLFRIPINADDTTGIREPSRLMVDKITTVLRSKLGEKIGRLTDDDTTKACADDRCVSWTRIILS